MDTVEESNESLVKMVNIHKWFGKVHAVRGVDFEVKSAEIVGLVGDNGAGKSTLIKVLSGFHQPDEGEIYFEGKKVKINSPRDARRLGIETVYQEQALAPHMSISRNIFMGREPVRSLGFLDRDIMNKESMKALRSIGLELRSPDDLIGMLSGGERQGVAIARAVHFKAKLVILDEPTRALSVKEVGKVLDFIKRVKDSGKSCIYISHTIANVYSVSDRFVILDRGRVVGRYDRKQISEPDLNEVLIQIHHAPEPEPAS